MNKFFLKLLLPLILFSVSQDLSGQVRKYSNEFLSVGVGARALAMGNANVASVHDVTAGYWNPAGLLDIKNDLQVALMHSEYFAGIAKFDYGSVAIPLKDKDRMLAFSLLRFGVDDIPNTLFLIEPDGTVNYDNVTSFSVADYAFLFSYAQPIRWKNLKVGANAKVIHRSAGSFAKAWGFGFDLGAQLELNDWEFGVMVRDITTTFNAWSFDFTEEEEAIFAQTNNVIPDNSYEITVPKLIAGVAYKKVIKEKFSVAGEINLDITTDGRRNVLLSADPFSIDPHLGVELGYSDFIFLRGGINNVQKVESEFDDTQHFSVQPNLGIGLKINNIGIDYAYTDIGDRSTSLYSHVFSLRVAINKNSKD